MSRIETMNSHDKLCAAMAIMQAHILASDTTLNAEALFGLSHFETAGLELAERLLDDCLPDIERACDWHKDNKAAA